MSKTDHVVVHDGTHKPSGTMECQRCGATERLAMPLPITKAVVKMDAFRNAHATCPEVAAP